MVKNQEGSFMWSWDDIRKQRKTYTQRFKNFFIFDIETVKDNQMLQEIGEEKDFEKAENGEFLHFPFHKIVAFSYIIVKNREIIEYKSFFSNNEGFIINKFWEKFKDSHEIETQNKSRCITHFPVLITINGKNFDIPTIKVRTLKNIHSIESKNKAFISIFLDKFDKWEDKYPKYTNKYTVYHIDIPIDIFGNKISLKKLAYLCNIPVKQEGDGKEVEDYYNRGDFEKIARYCGEDAKATALLFSFINEHLLYNTYNFPLFEEINSITGEIIIE
jgi:hypothetical protein